MHACKKACTLNCLNLNHDNTKCMEFNVDFAPFRTTAAGVHLVAARVGAIFGTNVFGEFVHVNPSIPILIVAVLLFVGALAALPLPKTTRKTLLK